MFSKKKGITPVIAIVLLLLITVGAVGVVYTQFQSLADGNEAEEELQRSQQIQQSTYSIIGVVDNGGNIDVTIKNTGDRVLNLDELGTLKTATGDSNTVAVEAQSGGSACNPGELAEGATHTCNTGLSWPGSDVDMKVEYQVGDAIKDSYVCTTSGGTC